MASCHGLYYGELEWCHILHLVDLYPAIACHGVIDSRPLLQGRVGLQQYVVEVDEPVLPFKFEIGIDSFMVFVGKQACRVPDDIFGMVVVFLIEIGSLGKKVCYCRRPHIIEDCRQKI